MKVIRTLQVLACMFLASCDEHLVEDMSWHVWKPGMVYCTNGEIMSYEECRKEGNTPEAVLYHVDKEANDNMIAYAVALRDSDPHPYSDPDTIYVSQGASTDINKMDGETNTSVLRYGRITSPIAIHIGARYVLPSVSEMYRLYKARDIVNITLEKCGGENLPVNDYACWYWTSTECVMAQTDRAWCFSLSSGRFEAEDKHVEHATRPIMVIRLNKEEI